VRPLAWCSRPRSGAAILGGALSDFEEHVRAALDELPPHLAAALENLAVVVEDEHPDDPDLFGLFQGVPLTERSSAASGGLPNKISIYRRPLEESFPDPDDLREEIRITVLHELAHYFGIEESRLSELGYE
jgi:predicted Zn-dependent protease with MMP-like domain